MDITRTINDGVIDVGIDGRLDGYWADHLDRTLTEIVRDGHHRIRLDCSRLTFLSSAGIAVLLKFRKQLGAINGSFQVVNPSKPVMSALQVTRLAGLLVAQAAAPAVSAKRPEQTPRRVERDGVALDVYELDPGAKLTCRAIGNPEPLTTGTFLGEHCLSLESLAPTFAVGVGAFGTGFEDCRTRFGEMVSVAGATAYQPADGANVPDYLVAADGHSSDVRVLYCLACEGRFSQLVRFETLQHGSTIALARLLSTCLDTCGVESAGVVIVAETAGLVGAALRRSPAEPVEDGDFFVHPAVRSRLSFTAEPAFPRGVALVAGVVKRASGDGPGPISAQLRPIGPDSVGHFHAAAFRFHPIKKGPIDFKATVSGLFAADHQLLGVLHLLCDDRGAGGAGESEFVRGACWMGSVDLRM